MSTKSTTRPISKAIADLEVAALAGHAAGQRPGQFFLRHWTALGRVARGGPAVYDALAARLLRLLASGGGGDGDQVDQGQGRPPAVVAVPAGDAAELAALVAEAVEKQKAGKGVDGSGGRGKKKNLTQKIGEGFSAEANGRHERETDAALAAAHAVTVAELAALAAEAAERQKAARVKGGKTAGRGRPKNSFTQKIEESYSAEENGRNERTTDAALAVMPAGDAAEVAALAAAAAERQKAAGAAQAAHGKEGGRGNRKPLTQKIGEGVSIEANDPNDRRTDAALAVVPAVTAYSAFRLSQDQQQILLVVWRLTNEVEADFRQGIYHEEYCWGGGDDGRPMIRWRPAKWQKADGSWPRSYAAAVSRSLRRLEHRGLVETWNHVNGDERKRHTTCLRLTEAGRQVAVTVNEKRQAEMLTVSEIGSQSP